MSKRTGMNDLSNEEVADALYGDDYIPGYEPEPVQPVVKTPIDYSLVNHAFVVASREPGVQYEIGQAGEKEFTYNDVLFICYRLEVPLSDAEIKAYVRKSVRAGILSKGSKRNLFQMSHLMRQTHDDLMAEFREIQARRNPTQR